MANKDPRIVALRRFALSITVFTLLGHTVLGFEQSWLTPIAALLIAYALELLLETLEARVERRPVRYRGSAIDLVNFLLPAHIGGLACAMLLYGNERLWPTLFAVTVAIASKYVVRVRLTAGGAAKHVLNPSNFGIVVTLLCFTWVGIAPPYQFTANINGIWDWVVPGAILAAGTMLNAKLTRRGPLVAAWVAGFAAQAVLRSVIFDHALVAALLPMTGVAFVLFTNYMITDPGTTPHAPRRQVVFGLATAAVYGTLVLLHIEFGLFFALTTVCVGRWVVIVTARRIRERRQPVTGPGAPERASQSAVPVGAQA
ncbi:enediyne biosynthesis protein UnbU [Micromonospora sp. WMMC273]|uniref:enediyne biosynthesis protein UnbU n=1 Tax=Micromonospora sp. WMMC273 TaxID=3015157 RepID=UPI0022B7530C|nr:enediyne biosynthesis protein UnbU [Micromonospora sp. WMMC273]MCZ7474865.1 enediyne biosynthesis protein UnbU [Micromonospora sp. WMMC273]